MHSSHRPIPHPAHRVARRVPLPWEHPKPHEEDVNAEARLSALMHDPAYAEADRDVGFLHEDDQRGVRLQLDYLKTEGLLEAHGIERTIVVFGSTRLREPATAQRELAAARQAATAHPEDTACARALHLAERRMELSRYYDIGRELGRLVGSAGDPTLAVLTGGGPGGMEAANRGAFDVGAKTIGLNITLPRKQFPNPYLTQGLCTQLHYFATRKLHFMKRAVGLVALPGGFGTLDELFGALTLIQTRKAAPMPIVLVGEAYWRSVFNADFLVEAGSIDEEDRELFWYAESAEDAWNDIRAWHALNGGPLLHEKAPESKQP